MKTIYQRVDTNGKLYQAKTITCVIFSFQVKRLYPPLMKLRVFNNENYIVYRDIWITKFAQSFTFLSNETIHRLRNDSGTCKHTKAVRFYGLYISVFG